MSDFAWALAAVNRTGLPVLPHDILLEIYALLDVPAAVTLAKVSSLRPYSYQCSNIFVTDM